MKRKFKVLSILLPIIFSFSILLSCSPYREVKNVSKGLSSYDISVVIDDESHSLSAVEKVVVVNKYDVSLDKICFNVYSRAFREDAEIKPYTSLNEGKCFPNGVNYGDIIINSIKLENQSVDFSFVGEDFNAIEIALNKPLEPGDNIVIEINFLINLAECIHRMGYYDNSINLGNWFPILAMYEKGEFIIEPYYSTGDPFYSEIANYNVEVTYSSDYYLSSSGKERTLNIDKNTKKDKITALAVRDFAIFLTKDSSVKSKIYEDTTISYVGYNQDENIDYVLTVAKNAIKYFSETFGGYPYETLDIVKAPFLHGGMEYPSVVVISDSIKNDFDLAKVIVHEIAHQWWYAVVGNNEIKEAWLDESLAEYSSVLFFADHKEFDVSYEELVSESFASYTLFADIVSSINKKINTSMLLPVNEYNSEYEYSYMIYVRGVLMFDSIGQVVGQDNIKTVLRKYYSKYKFKIARTDDLIALMRSATKKNVEGVMDSWLNGKTVIGTI